MAFRGCSLANGLNCNTVDKKYHPNDGWFVAGTIKSVGSPFDASLDLTKCRTYRSVESYAFNNSKVGIVKLPSLCISIGESAFNNCSQMRELHINSNTISFGNYALYGCSILTDIYFNKDCDSITVGNDWCYGIGQSSSSQKAVHITSYMYYNTGFLASQFYLDLVNNGFTCVII
jgi:hypothetical protein